MTKNQSVTNFCLKFLMTLLVFVLLTLIVANTAKAEEVSVGDWTYNIENGVATISSYNGKSQSVTIPTSQVIKGVNYKIRTVGKYAFEGNQTLKKVIIPDAITKLGDCAFKNCTNLSEVEIRGNLADCAEPSSWGDDSKNCSIFYNTGSNADSFKVTFASGVTRVPAFIFATGQQKGDNVYSHITDIIIADSVKEIGRAAFFRCYDLKNVQIGKNITLIEESAFEYDESIQNIMFNEHLVQIEARAFFACTALKKIDLPKTVTTLGKCAFKNCTNLSEVVIRGNLADCAEPSSWGDDSKNYSIFYNTGSNADSFKVTFASGVTRIPAFIFATGQQKGDDVYSHITDIIIADSVKEIGRAAFFRCYDLKNVQIGKNITLIEESAFEYDESIQNIMFNEHLVQIEARAFFACTALKKIDLPKTVTTLGKCAFKNCTNLSEVVIRGNLADCAEPSSWGDDSKNYSIFYNTGSNADSFKVTFASGVTRIPAFIFATGQQKGDNVYAHITQVTIPATVKEIGKCAFYRCYDLKRIDSATVNATVGEDNLYGSNDNLVVYTKHNTAMASTALAQGYKVNYTDLSAVTTKDAVNLASGIKITWNKLSEAKGYYIYRKLGNGNYTKVKQISNVNTTSWTDTTVKNNGGKVYTYCVKAYNGSKTSTKYNGRTIARLISPTISVANVATGVKVTWKKVAGASGYDVYRDGKYIRSVSSTTLSYIDTTLSTSGKKCTYKVIPYKQTSSYYSEAAPSANKTIFFVKATTVNGTANSASKKMTVNWNKVSGVAGYQIQYSTSKDFKNAKTVNVSGSNKYSRIISGLTKNKTYYVRIRTYKKISGANRFSAWSGVKSRKITK